MRIQIVYYLILTTSSQLYKDTACDQTCEFGCVNGSCQGKCLSKYKPKLQNSKFICIQCTGDCVNCEQGYYQSENRCQPCMSGCFQCITKEYCSCQFPCLYCDSQGCLKCTDGYYLFKRSCNALNYSQINRLLAINCNAGYQLYYITLNDCNTCGVSKYCTYDHGQFYNICFTYKLSTPTTSVPIADCSTCTQPICKLCAKYSNTEDCFIKRCFSNYCVDNSGGCLQASANYCESNSLKYCNFLSCISCPSKCQICQLGNCYCLSSNDSTVVIYMQNSNCPQCLNGYYQETESKCQICNSSCSTCISTQCLTCVQSNYYPAAVNTSNNCLPCYSTCTKCTAIDSCQECSMNYHISGGFCCHDSCSNCTISTCSICKSQNMYVNGLECIYCTTGCSSCTKTQCLGCYNLNQYPSGQNCVTCPTQCTRCDGLICSQCQIPCTECNMTKCLQCAEGYYLNSLNICNQCQPDCKTCNMNGCLTCKTQIYQLINFRCIICQENCTSCIQSNIFNEGYCLQCNQTYYLNRYGVCQRCPIQCLTCINGTTCIVCSNPLTTIQSNCLCTQNQFQQFDLTCIDCQYPCTQCKSKVYCTQCAGLVGLQLQNFKCICSSNSYQISDGSCQLCSSQCQTCDSLGCLTCLSDQYRILQNNKCICQSGYIDVQQDICLECSSPQGQITQQCQYINCGDGYWTYGEQCDDGNNIIRDGCSNCQIDKQYYCINTILQTSLCYQCSVNCLACNQSGCLTCANQYKLINNQCQLICPNNCKLCRMPSQCQKCIELYEITPDQQCQLFQQGETYLSTDSPLKQDIFLGGAGYNKSIAGLATLLNQDVKLNNLTISLCVGFQYQLVSMSIEGISESSITYQYLILNQIIALNFTSLSDIQQFNLIHILLIQIHEDYNTTIQLRVTPYQQLVYNSDQQAQIASVQKTAGSLTQSFQYITPLTVVLGGFDSMMNILQVIAWISNLYFINVNYPGNVNNFFQLMSLNSIFQIPNILTLNQPTDDYYRPAPQRYVDQGQDPLFINNVQQIIIMISLLLVLKPFLIIYQYCKEHIKSKKALDVQEDVDLTIKQKKIKRILVEFMDQQISSFNQHYKSYLFQNINLNLLDISLAISLQIIYQMDIQYRIIQINLILSLVSALMILISLYQIQISTSKHAMLLEQEMYAIEFDSIYEGINVQKQIGKKYGFVSVLRKILFIFALVGLYEYPLLYATICTVVYSTSVAILLYENPFDSVKHYIKYGVPDILMFITIGMTVIYALDDQIMSLTQDTRFNIGWFILTAILLQITIQLYFIIVELWHNLGIFIKKVSIWIQETRHSI